MAYGTLNVDSITTSTGHILGAGNATAFKNRIINGGMVINQRVPGTTVTLDTSQNYQFLDRYRFVGGFSSYTNTVQQSTTAPSGFSTSLLWTNTASAGAISSGAYNSFQQNIEGYNIFDLAWGTADAKPITLSFWVRSSVIGTYGVTFTNGTNYYVASYTVNTANTWEQKTVSIVGATTGTWNTSSLTGLTVKWDMGVGTTYSASAGTWGTGNIWGLTGGIKFVETNGATFYITGVQLEVGTQATSFDFRDIGRELILCQRYYEKSYEYGTVPGTNTQNGVLWSSGAQALTTSYIGMTYSWKVQKRSSPTVVAYDKAGTSGVLTRWTLGSTEYDGSNYTTGGVFDSSWQIYSSGSGNAAMLKFHFTASAEL